MPTLWYRDETRGELRGTIICLHGVLSRKENLHDDCTALAQAGFLVIAPDAPYHGDREDKGLLHAVTEGWKGVVIPEYPRPGARIHEQAARELPGLVDVALAQTPRGVGIWGYSMGGMMAFRAVTIDPRLKAAVCLNATPVLKDTSLNPAEFPQRFAPCALMIVNARLDEGIAPDPAREFAQTLKPFYHNMPERLEYVEYEHSGHYLRPEDWADFRQRAAQWFGKHLSNAA